jgi:hypothetical protein
MFHSVRTDIPLCIAGSKGNCKNKKWEDQKLYGLVKETWTRSTCHK